MDGRSPAERSLHARLAAHVKWAGTDNPSAATASARQAFMSRFEAEVDPDCQLSPEERGRRAEHARKAYFARLSMASAKARRARRRGAAA